MEAVIFGSQKRAVGKLCAAGELAFGETMEEVMKMMLLCSIYSGITIADHWALFVEEGRRLKAWAMNPETTGRA